MNILWLGPLQSDQGMLCGTAPHPATMRWQRMFISGLRQAGHSVRWIGHEPHRTWPWGPLRIASSGAACRNHTHAEGIQIAYTNLGRIRTRSLLKAYFAATQQAIRDEAPDVILTYNADRWIQGAAEAAMRAAVPWVPLILECRNPLIDDWQEFQQETAHARGAAFISYWAFVNAPIDRKHLLAAAVVPRQIPAERPSGEIPPMILYSGGRSRDGGIDRLVAALPLLKTRSVRLVITGQGKGLDHQITRACENTPGVEDLGMVPESRLVELAATASVLVNPRPIEYGDNRTNFPSKLLDYLSFKRPIVSTRTAGIGPGYEELVHFAASDTPQDIAAAIDDVFALTDQERDLWMQRIAAAIERMTPSQAATDLARWIESLPEVKA